MTVYPSDDAEITQIISYTITALTELGNQNDHSCITWPFFEPLFNYDTIQNKVAPGLAESWEQIDDVTLRVKLYEGITSIMGDPVTTSDVLWSFNYYNDSGLLPTYYSIIDFEKTKIIDDLTIDIVTKSPYPYLTLDMTCHYFTIGCEKTAKAIAYDEATGTWDQLKMDWNPNYGTGPYKLVDTDETTYFKTERNENYWQGTLPYYKYLNMTVVIDETARGMAVESGDGDFASKLSATSGANLADSGFNVWYTSTLGDVIVFRMNTEVEALRNKELRQAIALAIDYEAFCQVAYGGVAIPAYNAMCPSTTEYYTQPDDATNFIRYDLDLAKQKMKESGYADGIDFELLYSTAMPAFGKVAESLQFMLKEIGVNCTLDPMENLASFDKAKQGDFELYISGAQNPNPKINVSRVDPKQSYASQPGWTNPQYWYEGDLNDLQALVDRVYYSTDTEDHMAAWAEIQALTREYVPMFILVQPTIISAGSSDLIGMTFTADGDPNMAWFYPAEYITG